MLDPLIKAPNRPQTDVLDMLNLANPYGTVIAKAVADNLQKMGPRGASGGTGAPGVRPNPNWAQMAHLWWVAFLGPLDGSCRVWRHLELI